MFKFVFQNGEFVSGPSTLMGISIDAIFTVLTTILIFGLGYIVTQRIEGAKERKRLNQLQEYFLKLIVILELPLLKQRDAFLKFSRELKKKREQHLFLGDVSIFGFDQIKEINSIDLYTIFVKHGKGEISLRLDSFAKFRGQIEFLEQVKISMNLQMKEFVNEYDKYVSDYRENLKVTSDYLTICLATMFETIYNLFKIIS